MKYVIDTDILIYFLKNEPKVVQKFNEVDTEIIINLAAASLCSFFPLSLSSHKCFICAVLKDFHSSSPFVADSAHST